jgi:hypothetical protein
MGMISKVINVWGTKSIKLEKSAGRGAGRPPKVLVATEQKDKNLSNA